MNLGNLDEFLPAPKSLNWNYNPDALMNLGIVYKDLGRLDQALLPLLILI